MVYKLNPQRILNVNGEKLATIATKPSRTSDYTVSDSFAIWEGFRSCYHDNCFKFLSSDRHLAPEHK